MPDLENRMPELLHHLASDARPDPELAHRVLRRSRRRRVANVAAAGLTVAVVLVGAFLAVGAVGTWGRTTTADEGMPPGEVAPTALPAIWPETDARSLAIAQALADRGTLDWRLDPTSTAEMYATQELGWRPADMVVTGSASDPESGTTTVTIARSDFSDGPSTVPETELTLRRLGATGAEGIWSVVSADTAVILPGQEQDGRWPTSALAGSQLELVGTRVGEGGEWTLIVSTAVFTPMDETGIGSNAEASGMSTLGAQAGPFTESVFIPAHATGIVVVSLAIADEQGTTVALDAFPVAVEPPGGSVGGTPIAAVWPETTSEGLQTAQVLADDGELPWRLDPVGTAAAFATDVLGWDPTDVQTDLSEWITGGDAPPLATVAVTNAGLGPGQDAEGPPAPATFIRLEQLGTQGDRGVWSVTRAASDHIEIDTLTLPPDGPILEGRVVDDAAPEWRLSVWLIVGDRRLDTATPVSIDPSGAFTVQITDVGGYPEGTMIGLLTALWDPEGTLVTADATNYLVGTTLMPPTPSGPTGPSGATGSSGPSGLTGPFDQLPSAVLATRDGIATSAEVPNFDALEALIDPDHFSYNFDDGSNPVPEWRDDPSVLDTLATILQMPSTTTEGTPDVGTVYIWPSLVDADLTDPTKEERGMLETLGFTDADVQDMLDAFGGYVGPRTGIAEDGTWLFYTTGGD